MKHEGLDPKGKVELARMLLQIGFKAEAIAEFLMAAKMYEETEGLEQAIKLYERILSIDEGNAEAQRALYRLEPRSQGQIDEIIAKMGFGPSEESKAETSAQPVSTPEVKEPEISQPPRPEVQELAPREVSAPREEVASTPEVAPEPEQGESRETPDLARIEIDEFLASLTVTLEETPDDLGPRKQLAEFFTDEALWSDAFFEAKASYLAKPSLDTLHELIIILSHMEDKETLLSFLLAESYLDRPPDVQRELLERLIGVCEKEGLSEKAAQAKEKLARFGAAPAKPQVKIIGDTPRLAEKDDNASKDKKPSGPIQFI